MSALPGADQGQGGGLGQVRQWQHVAQRAVSDGADLNQKGQEWCDTLASRPIYETTLRAVWEMLADEWPPLENLPTGGVLAPYLRGDMELISGKDQRNLHLQRPGAPPCSQRVGAPGPLASEVARAIDQYSHAETAVVNSCIQKEKATAESRKQRNERATDLQSPGLVVCDGCCSALITAVHRPLHANGNGGHQATHHEDTKRKE